MSSIVKLSNGTIVGLGGAVTPHKFFQNFFNVYIYIYMYVCVLILAICFNKFALCPLNNIIDIFKCYKNFY